MPELPEIEATRQSFATAIAGAQVLEVFLGKPLRWPLGCKPQSLESKFVGTVWRRGKYLWLPLGEQPLEASPDGPPGDQGGLLMHLGMSGALRFAAHLGSRGPHDHFELRTSQGTLRLTDPRRFGAVIWNARLDQGLPARLLATLGLEPFDPGLTGALMHRAWRGKRLAIKPALLAGDVVVGAGNIYACEALFLAGIDPRLAAGRLSLKRCERLLEMLRLVLGQAIELGGTSLRNFSNAHGQQGQFQHHCWVYGREGEACRRCQHPVKRVVQGQRSSFFCPQCQKR